MDDFVQSFTSQRSKYSVLANRTAELLTALLEKEGIEVHIIESRAKDIESLREKLKRPSKNYAKLSQVPDLAGVRIITYYEDDCDRVCAIIDREFDVVEREDGHKASSLESDRFGYLSLHRVVKSHHSRQILAEWESVAELHCEIQVRTVIQHAWAAVSHQVQYKLESRVPSKLQRRLNRISGLFELADEQFRIVRDQRLQAKVSDIDAMRRERDDASLTPTILSQFVADWNKKQKAEHKSKVVGFIFEEDFNRETEDHILQICAHYDVTKIGELSAFIGEFSQSYMMRLYERHRDRDSNSDSWTISQPFTVLLHLIRGLNKVSADDLIALGWSPRIASDVVEVARS